MTHWLIHEFLPIWLTQLSGAVAGIIGWELGKR